MSPTAYRSVEPVFEERLSALRAKIRDEAPLASEAKRVAIDRVARTLGGAAGSAGAVAAFATSIVAMVSHDPRGREPNLTAVELLLASWPLALLLRGSLPLLTAAFLRPVLAPRPTGDPHLDLARTEDQQPLLRWRRMAARWEFASLASPMVALSMLAPLTLHFVVWIVFANVAREPGEAWVPFGEFGVWMGLGVILVGHAHVVLAAMSTRWAWDATRKADRVEPRGGWGRALFVTVAASCVPGILAFGIPPVIVALTGFVFVPLMFSAARRRLEAERQLLRPSTEPAPAQIGV